MSRSLRACMVCSIVQPSALFMRSGCPNCEEILNLRGSSDAVNDCTSPVFEGLITMGVQGGVGSWVARWQRLEGYVAGTYAVKVQGILPSEVVGALEERGVGYVPRDGSASQDDAE